MRAGRLSFSVATIASGQSLSNEVDLTSFSLVAIQMPADWDAANLTFQARPGLTDDVLKYPNEILQNVHDDAGTEVSVTAAADRYIALTAAKLDALTGCGKVKIRSGASGAAVNQAADRVILLVLTPIV